MLVPPSLTCPQVMTRVRDRDGSVPACSEQGHERMSPRRLLAGDRRRRNVSDLGVDGKRCRMAARLIIHRPSWSRGPRTVGIQVNDVQRGDLERGGTLESDVPAGEVTVAEMNGGCPGASAHRRPGRSADRGPCSVHRPGQMGDRASGVRASERTAIQGSPAAAGAGDDNRVVATSWRRRGARGRDASAPGLTRCFRSRNARSGPSGSGALAHAPAAGGSHPHGYGFAVHWKPPMDIPMDDEAAGLGRRIQ